ncbi:hypothetical protein QQ991_10735 [Weizmannia coagulans]|uniref:Uncharacterized protein n=2 Tax=Heyndrickxia TaxID=2837504 RepID=A0AAN0WC90_HEYCO|nr:MULTISPECIES: hypothetical protein [Heyndrickxia]AJO22874.1 hypothetical protein SB48_HM08orf03296 [Heyndrickxia coagulans]ATW83114.1 hypothetical protein CIW84_09045 [Heyndrickxia coagulans]AVD56222.1 hypothetical protein C3766_08790 [Heyndrickxia coagulans]KGB28321.1 hypothetical protein IE89_17195 [Heyndrickxia coagulans]KXT22097.1 hypothetical protein UZ35_00600 [Heyndrickxia coagulans]
MADFPSARIRPERIYDMKANIKDLEPERYNYLFNNGLLTINEVRTFEGLPNIGAEGNKLFRPLKKRRKIPFG